jgi:hypothetical protein
MPQLTEKQAAAAAFNTQATAKKSLAPKPIEDVTFTRPEYRVNLELWRMVNDVCAGEHAIKRKGTHYLPRPNPEDISRAADIRYAQYLTRAVFYNATGRTLSAMIGMAFNSWPTVNLPSAIENLEEDIDGAGLNLVQQAQATMGQVLKTGRAGLLVDYPPVASDTSKADQLDAGVRATVNYYPADAIINWRTERVNGVRYLKLVVLREQFDKVGAFTLEPVTQYRVLKIDDLTDAQGNVLQAGVYKVEIWQLGGESSASWHVVQEYWPKDGAGKNWTEIPFAFVGAVRNTPDLEAYSEFASYAMTLPDMTVSPLYDLAVLNLGHYRNSADYEESVFFTGQPQAWMSGLTEEWRDKLVADGVQIGSRSILPLPQGGAFGIAQAKPNQLAYEAMQTKERQMFSLGARLLEPDSQAKTATQAKFEAGKDHSVLSLVCDNVSNAYTQALQWAALFNGAADWQEALLSIDTEFVVNSLDAPSITAAVQAWQAGSLPDADLWGLFRKVGLIDPSKTDDEIREEIDAQTPAGSIPAILTAGDPTAPPVPAADPAQANNALSGS